MSEDVKSTETDNNEEKSEKQIAGGIEIASGIQIEAQAEVPEENKEEERPGFCCGSCS